MKESWRISSNGRLTAAAKTVRNSRQKSIDFYSKISNRNIMEAIFDSSRRRHLALFVINFMDKELLELNPSRSVLIVVHSHTPLFLISTVLCFSIITSSEFLSLIQHATMAIIKREVKEGRLKLSHAHFYWTCMYALYMFIYPFFN